MVFASQAILAVVIEGIKFVTPVAGEIEPLGGCVGRYVGGVEGVSDMVVGVGVGVEDWIPERAAVGLVMEEAKGKDVGVDAGSGVHGMGTGGGVDDRLCFVLNSALDVMVRGNAYPFANLLYCVVAVC